MEKNSFFIHSFDIPHKCAKNNFSGEIKNTVPLPVYIKKTKKSAPTPIHPPQPTPSSDTILRLVKVKGKPVIH